MNNSEKVNDYVNCVFNDPVKNSVDNFMDTVVPFTLGFFKTTMERCIKNNKN